MNLIEIGDCRDTMRRWSAAGVRAQTCVTSPPYFGLRDYGHPGQLGLEATPEAYIAAMVDVFRCVRDVLAEDGTLWLNLGDSYGASKQLLGVPWRLALALQGDGWCLRQDIIWHKPNVMPEAVTDRCTKSHEYLFLLTKSAQYFYDNDAIREPCSEANVRDFLARKTLDNKGGGDGTYGEARPDLCRSRDAYMPKDFMRNRRSVWTVNTKPFVGAHFATFPPALIEPCILAGTREGDTVLDPFMGSGTTAMVAKHNGRRYLGCELNPDYAVMQRDRVASPRELLDYYPVVPSDSNPQFDLFAA